MDCPQENDGSPLQRTAIIERNTTSPTKPPSPQSFPPEWVDEVSRYCEQVLYPFLQKKIKTEVQKRVSRQEFEEKHTDSPNAELVTRAAWTGLMKIEILSENEQRAALKELTVGIEKMIKESKPYVGSLNATYVGDQLASIVPTFERRLADIQEQRKGMIRAFLNVVHEAVEDPTGETRTAGTTPRDEGTDERGSSSDVSNVSDRAPATETLLDKTLTRIEELDRDLKVKADRLRVSTGNFLCPSVAGNPSHLDPQGIGPMVSTHHSLAPRAAVIIAARLECHRLLVEREKLRAEAALQLLRDSTGKEKMKRDAVKKAIADLSKYRHHEIDKIEEEKRAPVVPNRRKVKRTGVDGDPNAVIRTEDPFVILKNGDIGVDLYEKLISDALDIVCRLIPSSTASLVRQRGDLDTYIDAGILHTRRPEEKKAYKLKRIRELADRVYGYPHPDSTVWRVQNGYEWDHQIVPEALREAQWEAWEEEIKKRGFQGSLLAEGSRRERFSEQRSDSPTCSGVTPSSDSDDHSPDEDEYPSAADTTRTRKAEDADVVGNGAKAAKADHGPRQTPRPRTVTPNPTVAHHT